MKYFLTAGWAVICIVVLFMGRSYWHERTSIHPDSIEENVVSALASPSTTANASAAESAAPANVTKLLALAKNWPAPAQAQFKQALHAKKPMKLLFLGSKAMGDTDKGLAHDISAKVTEAYGKGVIETAIQSSDLTSSEFLAQKKPLEVASEKAQLILFEPFVLNDNGNVETKTALDNLTKIIAQVTSKNPDSTFILQPSYPVFNAKFYPLQVDALKKYAGENHLAYLDHWQAWPDYRQAALKNYLLPDQSGPNAQGYGVWEKYIEEYLIGN